MAYFHGRRLAHFNPHFPHGKWRKSRLTSCMVSYFNPHFPHGKWPRLKGYACSPQWFQSTLPSREVTAWLIFQWVYNHLFQSTLPSREVTFSFIIFCSFKAYFNPHFPHGKWPKTDSGVRTIPIFQSTLPSREVTAILHKKIIEYVIMLYYLSIKLYKQIIIGKHIFSISEYIKQKNVDRKSVV